VKSSSFKWFGTLLRTASRADDHRPPVSAVEHRHDSAERLAIERGENEGMSVPDAQQAQGIRQGRGTKEGDTA
jgi:hypothetical protein